LNDEVTKPLSVNLLDHLLLHQWLRPIRQLGYRVIWRLRFIPNIPWFGSSLVESTRSFLTEWRIFSASTASSVLRRDISRRSSIAYKSVFTESRQALA